MLKNPSPDQILEIGSEFFKVEVVYLIPSVPSDWGYCTARLYRTQEDYLNDLCIKELPLGFFEFDMQTDNLWDVSHAFALQTFQGFEIIDSLEN